MALRNPRPFRDKTLAFWQEEGSLTTPAWAFNPQNPEGWREGLRELLGQRLGFPEGPRGALRPEVLSTWEGPDCHLEKVVFEASPHLSVPAYVLRPRSLEGASGGETRPAVICLADHGPGKVEAVGFVDRGWGADYALQLARAGYVTIAPEARTCGEREEDEEHTFLAGLLLDRPLTGARVWDVLRTVDYLLTRPEVNPERIGCLGLGLGGWLTLLAAGIDERIRCAVVSGFFGTLRACLLDRRRCSCFYVPGLMRIADLPDLAALVAPRPLFLEQGKYDPDCPLAVVRQAYLKLRYAYDTLGAGQNLEMEVFEGGHRFWGQRSLGWIRRWLRTW